MSHEVEINGLPPIRENALECVKNTSDAELKADFLSLHCTGWQWHSGRNAVPLLRGGFEMVQTECDRITFHAALTDSEMARNYIRIENHSDLYFRDKLIGVLSSRSRDSYFQQLEIEGELIHVPENCASVPPQPGEWGSLSMIPNQDDPAGDVPGDPNFTGAACPECGGKGYVELFSSTQPCSLGCKP